MGGLIELRSAIANHLKQFRGMDVKAEQIIIGSGTEYLYGQIVAAFWELIKYTEWKIRATRKQQ